MKITGVRYRRLDMGPRPEVVRNAHLAFERHTSTLIEVSTDEAITGVAVTAGRAAFGSRHYVEGALAEAVIGHDPFRVSWLWERMMEGWRKPVTKGEVITCLSGIDIALWDIIGKAVNRPLYQLLGAHTADKVPVYAAGGYYAGSKDTAKLVEEILSYVALGHTRVKMKVGGTTLKDDVERLGAVREAVGPDITIMLDANYAWRAWEALKYVRELAVFNPFWIEEPTRPDDIDGLRRVRDHSPIPVATGENEYCRWGARRLLEADATDFLQIDANIGGGVTEWIRVANLAGAHHVPMAPHGDPQVHAHLVAAVPNGVLVESYPSLYGYMEPIVGKLPVHDGWLDLPTGPGLGMELDWDLIERITVEA
jgi:D-arabinonate dehydratase